MRKGVITWVVILAVLGGIFGLPPLVRYLAAPNISASFGLEDAVVALRVEARDEAYLMLINEAGETRSVRVGERGFEKSELAWSDLGLSVGGPETEYLLGEDGLQELPVPNMQRATTERQRLPVAGGFATFMGSPHGQTLAFVDAGADPAVLRTLDAGITNPVFGSCSGQLVALGESEVRQVNESTTDLAALDGLGPFDDVDAVACDEHAAAGSDAAGSGAPTVYGLGHVWGDPEPRQVLRAWPAAGGAPRALEIRYPRSIIGSTAHTFFVRNGTAYWTIDGGLWSASLDGLQDSADGPAGSADAAPQAGAGAPSGAGAGAGADTRSDTGATATVDAVLVDYVREYFGDNYQPAVQTDQGALAVADGRVFGMALDEELISSRRGASYRKLHGMAVFSVDVETGSKRVELTIDDVDVPRRDVRVTAVAVNPQWATSR